MTSRKKQLLEREALQWRRWRRARRQQAVQVLQLLHLRNQIAASGDVIRNKP